MRRGKAFFRFAAGALVAWTLRAPAAASEEELPSDVSADAASVAAAQAACANEIGLFCKGETGAALLDCLSAYRGSATARCLAALRAPDPAAPAVKVWASSAYAGAAGAAEAKSFGPDAASLPEGAGFDFVSSEKIAPYSLSDAQAHALLAQLRASGLKDKGGGAGSEPAAFALSFDYAAAPRAGGCAVVSAHVRLGILEAFPQRAAAAAPADGGAEWRDLDAALRAHAEGHKKISERAGRELLSRLQALRPRPSCADVDAAVQALFRRERLDARQRDEAYDARTGRGRKQVPAAGAGARR